MADKIFPTQITDWTPDSADIILFADVSNANATKDCTMAELPISNATQTALNAKADASTLVETIEDIIWTKVKGSWVVNVAYNDGTWETTISAVGLWTWDMQGANNLSELTDESIARSNLGLWTLATQSGTFSDKEDIANKSTSVTTDQASNIKYPSVKSVYDWAVWAFAKYSGDADFYQYSISRTVDWSGNLTVALLNFEWNTPTPTKPVKIMIGGVVRTITSALSITMVSGVNWANAGSSELATKEIDYFAYIIWDSVNSIPKLSYSRLPSATILWDFVFNITNEKWIVWNSLTNTPNDQVVNIGRFNAILSGGWAYTWSIGTSIIINNPILQTRYLDYTPVGAGYTAGWARYRIDWNNVNLIIDSTANITGNITTPFTCTNTVDNQMITNAGTAVLPKNSNTITVATNPQNISWFYWI